MAPKFVQKVQKRISVRIKLSNILPSPFAQEAGLFLGRFGDEKCTEWPDFYYHAAEILAGTCNTTSSWTNGQTERSMNGYLSSFLLGPLFCIHKQSCTITLDSCSYIRYYDTSFYQLKPGSAFLNMLKPYDWLHCMTCMLFLKERILVFLWLGSTNSNPKLANISKAQYQKSVSFLTTFVLWKWTSFFMSILLALPSVVLLVLLLDFLLLYCIYKIFLLC